MNASDYRAEVAKEVFVALISNQATIDIASDKNISLSALAVRFTDLFISELNKDSEDIITQNRKTQP